MVAGVAAAVVAIVRLGGWLAPAPPLAPHVVTVATDPGRPAVLASVGDTLIGAEAAPLVANLGPDRILAFAAEAVAGADALMGNLEAPITTAREPFIPDKEYVYKQLPDVAGALRRHGFDALVLANNHTLDYGVQGLRDTLSALDAVGIGTLGAGENAGAARRGVVVDLGPGRRVGLLAVMARYGSYARHGWFAGRDRAGVAEADPAALRADVAALRAHADVVVVHLHAGSNYRDVRSSQERLARAAIDAGADVVNGHHPHVVQPLEVYRGKPILYSLGNYVFGTLGRFEKYEQPGLGVVARYHVDDRRVVRIELVGLEVDNRKTGFRPRLASVDRVVDVLLPRIAARGAEVHVEGGRVIWEP